MDKERWQLVERIYHAALEREGDERAAFLTEACEGDQDLRREVEALIAEDSQAGSFIENGKQLAFSRGVVSSDVVLISGFNEK